jgi:hypothetical protein
VHKNAPARTSGSLNAETGENGGYVKVMHLLTDNKDDKTILSYSFQDIGAEESLKITVSSGIEGHFNVSKMASYKVSGICYNLEFIVSLTIKISPITPIRSRTHFPVTNNTLS